MTIIKTGLGLLSVLAIAVPAASATGAHPAAKVHHQHHAARKADAAETYDWTLVRPDGTTQDYGTDLKACLDAAQVLSPIPDHPLSHAEYEQMAHCAAR